MPKRYFSFADLYWCQGNRRWNSVWSEPAAQRLQVYGRQCSRLRLTFSLALLACPLISSYLANATKGVGLGVTMDRIRVSNRFQFEPQRNCTRNRCATLGRYFKMGHLFCSGGKRGLCECTLCSPWPWRWLPPAWDTPPVPPRRDPQTCRAGPCIGQRVRRPCGPSTDSRCPPFCRARCVSRRWPRACRWDASKKKPFIFCSNEAKIESCLTMEFGCGARPGD